MFYNYKILDVDNEEVLYLYVNSMYEFSSELDKSNKPKSIFDKINKYIKDMDINFSGKKVMLVVNGIIIGTLVLVTNDFLNTNKKNQYISYKEIVDIDEDDNIDLIDKDNELSSFVKNNVSVNDSYIISNFVKMKNKDGLITYTDINNYIINSLSKIIPPTYEKEAIKSAAVITRTLVFQELYENDYLSDSNYNTINLQKLWKKDFNFYFNKFKDAVEETHNQYLLSDFYYFKFDDRKKYQVPFTSYGANILAKKGYKYIDILGHYYPDARLEIV